MSYKFAVIGKGFIYPRHERAIKNVGGEIVLSCDLEKPADYKDWVEMFHSPQFKDVDVVSVLTPNYLHSIMVREALFAGKKVICEKPVTIFNDLQDSPNLGIIFQLRYNDKVKKLKAEGFTGDINLIVKTYREPKYWESWKGQPEKSGGILYNMGVHYIDLLCHLLGEPLEILEAEHSLKRATGKIRFEKGVGDYHIELLTEPAPVTRKIMFNGIETDLEGATIPLTDNGEIIDLHTEVYKDFIAGNPIGYTEAKKSIDLINKLYAN